MPTPLNTSGLNTGKSGPENPGINKNVFLRLYSAYGERRSVETAKKHCIPAVVDLWTFQARAQYPAQAAR